MLKNEIRKKYKILRGSYTQKEIDLLSMDCFKVLQEYFSLKNKNVGVFLPISNSNEPNTFLLLNQFDLTGSNFYAPISNNESCEMDFFKIESCDNLTKGAYGILEPPNKTLIQPSDLDVVLLPLLAFNLQGHRIGYGKGFYDRYFNRTNKKIIKIGISLFDAVEIIEDINPLDVPMNFCATPRQFIDFKK
jgi:5-formyltetrahydrofolate cyclo-ligase